MPACQACAAPNPEGARFCSSCGERLGQFCPSCGAAASGRFCNECGEPLAGAVPAPASVAPPAAQPVAERRVTSVLFGDLVGFTTLSESRDAEDVRELLSEYFVAARTVIERYGGTVEKFIGDAVMAVWGVPTAHEDDAERAVRAGFDLVDAVSSLGERVGAAGLGMRVGVVTGEVAVTLGATGEGMVAGDAVNTASRVQAAAAPGEVWVDDATRELTAAAVAYADAGTHELKGKSEPMRLFRAQQVVASVGGVRRIDGLEAPFLGRDRELRMVKELFHACVEEGRPRLVSVVGPVGVGKSRLAWEFDKYTDGIDAVVRAHRGRCPSYGEGVAFWALSEIIRGRLDLLEGDPTDVVSQRLNVAMDEYVPDAEERAWLLPRLAILLGIGEAATRSFARDDLFAAWRTFLERVAVTEAVGAVVHIDDLQWADASLIEFLEHLIETARAPIFLVTFSRPEIAERFPSFGTGRRATTIYLEPLTQSAMSSVVDGLVDGLPDKVRDALVVQAEGIPLFAVETVRSLIDRDAVIPREGRYVLAADADQRVDLQAMALPTSLHTLVAARLDALPADERRTVQDAAVLGQSFTRDGLASVQAAVGTHLELDETLRALVRKEFLAVDSDPRSPERGHFRFVQAVVRGVAYETLSRRDRKHRHLAAFEYLSREADADSILAVLASHLLDARAAAPSDPDADDIATRAVELLERAATHSLDLGAPLEACGHVEVALSFVTDENTRTRLLEQAARASFAAGRIHESIEQAEQSRAGYEALGKDLDAARVLAFWAEAHIHAGTGPSTIDTVTAAYRRFVDQPHAEAVVAGLALQIARANYLSIGDTEEAILWFDRAVVLGEALEDLPFLASALASYAGALVLVGRQRMGIGLLQVALDLARQLDQPKLLVRPLNNLCCFLATRDIDNAAKYVDEAIALVRRLNDREWYAPVVASACHVLWTMGRWDEAIALADEVADAGEQLMVWALIASYMSAVKAARGEAGEVHLPSPNPLGLRTDLLQQATQFFLDAARAREAGELKTAAERSSEALSGYVHSSGIDDDFPLFWMAAVEDDLALADHEAAQEKLDIVISAPPGHVAPYLRAQLPRLRATLAISRGQDDNVETDLVAAIAQLDEFGAPFYVSRARLDYARWLIGQGRGDEAAPYLRAAREVFTQLRAAPWLSQVEELSAISVG